MQTNRTPSFGEAEAEAWAMVLEAIEDAIDVDDLSPFDRGELAAMYERAQFLAGATTEERCVLPDEWHLAGPHEPAAAVTAAYGPAGIGRLAIGNGSFNALLGHFTLISEVDEADDETLLALRGIGPTRLAQIRAAIDAHVLHTTQKES